MLELRICQQCGAKVGSGSSYFCHVCGARLSLPVDKEPGSVLGTVPLASPSNLDIPPFSPLKRRILIGLLALVLLGAISFFAYRYLFAQGRRLGGALPTNSGVSTAAGDRLVLEDSFTIPSHQLGKAGFEDHIPSDVVFYLEARSPGEFMFWLWGDTVQASLSAYTDYSIEELASYLESDFSLIERAPGQVAFLAKVISTDFWGRLLDELPPVDPYFVSLKGDLLVIANSTALVDDIDRAGRKAALSLSLSSEYSKAKRRLPSEGQFWFFDFTARTEEESLAFEKLRSLSASMGGPGLVAVKEGEKTVIYD